MNYLTKYKILIPCKMGEKTLTVFETVQLFFAYTVRYLGVP